MKTMFLSLAAVTLMTTANQAHSAPAVEPNTAQSIGTSAIPGEAGAGEYFFSAGAGLAMYGGNIGWAVNVGALDQVGDNSNLFWGLDFGLNFWSFQTPTVPGIGSISTGATAIQVLPTLMYRFQIDGPLFPYIGLSAGPNIYRTTLQVTDASGSRQDVSTDVYFEGLLRPGFFVNLGRSVSLQVEGKLGLLQTSFIFLPQASAVISL